MTQADAGMVGSIFGLLNFFARSLGGAHTSFLKSLSLPPSLPPFLSLWHVVVLPIHIRLTHTHPLPHANHAGYWSDTFNKMYGVRGRLWALFIQTVCMSIALISFSSLTRDGAGVGGMMINLVIWGIFTNMTEGATFAVVPYVLPTAIGGVAGITGAGGNVGAMLGNALMVVRFCSSTPFFVCIMCVLP
jgi:nitrate/nitrite transporter NarK